MSSPTTTVFTVHLEDGSDTDLDLKLIIVNIGENHGVVRMEYSNGEGFTLSQAMLTRVSAEVTRTRLREG
jgi:hypothetical protein